MSSLPDDVLGRYDKTAKHYFFCNKCGGIWERSHLRLGECKAQKHKLVAEAERALMNDCWQKEEA